MVRAMSERSPSVDVWQLGKGRYHCWIRTDRCMRPATIMGAVMEVLLISPKGQPTNRQGATKPWTADNLAEEAGKEMGREIEPKQVRRAISRLRRLGYPIKISQQLTPTREAPVYELDARYGAWHRMGGEVG